MKKTALLVLGAIAVIVGVLALFGISFGGLWTTIVRIVVGAAAIFIALKK